MGTNQEYASPAEKKYSEIDERAEMEELTFLIDEKEKIEEQITESNSRTTVERASRAEKECDINENEIN